MTDRDRIASAVHRTINGTRCEYGDSAKYALGAHVLLPGSVIWSGMLELVVDDSRPDLRFQAQWAWVTAGEDIVDIAARDWSKLTEAALFEEVEAGKPPRSFAGGQGISLEPAPTIYRRPVLPYLWGAVPEWATYRVDEQASVALRQNLAAWPDGTYFCDCVRYLFANESETSFSFASRT